MKHVLCLVVLATLGGCAVQQPGGYAGPGYAQPSDPSQWRVVSVTPVPAGTGDRVAANSASGSRVEYSSTPVSATRNIYVPTPIYVQQPVYVPQPIYQPEPAYYYPPVSLSLGFVFGRHWGGGYGYGHRHFRGGRR
jgi:hypothetical protein